MTTSFPTTVDPLTVPDRSRALGLTTPQHGQHHQDIVDTTKALERILVGPTWINVKSDVFGAVGDGTADDSGAIQGALDAAVGGGTVYFPPGTYRVDSTLTLTSNSVSLRGANKVGSKIRFADSVTPGLAIGDNVTQYHYIEVGHLTLSRTTPGAGPILKGQKLDQCIFRDCQFAGGTNVVEFDAVISSTIAGCGISSGTLIGMKLTNSDQVQIIGNYFEDPDSSTSPHLSLQSGNKNFSIVGNNFSTGTKALEIGIGPNTEHSIVGNTVENCLHGFDLDNGGVGLTRSVVVGNTLRGTAVGGGFGLILSSAVTDTAILGNTITNYAGALLTGTPGTNVVLLANPGIPNRNFTQVVATGSLPAAAAALDGTVLIEDGGAGDRNLILYAGGQRFRVDGGAAI